MITMTRGELAKKCGVNIEALRYYEGRGLIDPPPRSDVGYRQYSEEDAAKIRFIQNGEYIFVFYFRALIVFTCVNDQQN